MVNTVIYIHGFNSSNKSFKAQQFGKWIKTNFPHIHYKVPILHFDPKVAILQLEQLIDSHTVLVGSSLGGYYATYLSQRFNIRAVIINPAVKPSDLFADFLGTQYNPYQKHHYELTLEHIATLRYLYQHTIQRPKLIFLLQQIGDEILPFQQATQYYCNCKQYIEFAGDHSFKDFHRFFDMVVNFLKIT